jgi:hypothetical protein
MSADVKRKALEKIVAKLRKLLPHLGNGNTNEAAAALGKINQLFKSVGLDWHDLDCSMSGSRRWSTSS